MASSDKIVPFKQVRHREISEFRLKAEISIYICKNEEKYTCDCFSPDDNITIEEIMCILKKILIKISKKVSKIKVEANSCYKISFAILYYENIHNSNKYKYICLPKNIQLEKLAEYLYTFISIYEYKKTPH